MGKYERPRQVNIQKLDYHIPPYLIFYREYTEHLNQGQLLYKNI